MDWDYRMRAHGWSNAVFASAGAGLQSERAPIASAALIGADSDAKIVSFTLDGRVFDGLKNVSGVKLYVSTWDDDMAVHKLTRRAGRWSFGGGDGAVDPLILDDIEPIVLR